MYTLEKIDITDPAFTRVALSREFTTWKKLTATVNNGWTCGRGARIYCNGKYLGHTDDFNRIDRPTNRITLAQFRAAAAERLEQ